jgi:2-oxoisovalerate dehydrogenase E2 component (dihydrolipoyl transacylase)
VEISSRYDGVVTKLHFKVGDMVDTGAALVDIEIDDVAKAEQQRADADASEGTPAAAPAAAAASVAASVAARNAQVLTTPAVRKIAKENGVDLALVAASGPQGRILKSDVLDYVSRGGPAAHQAPSAAPVPARAAAAAPVAAAAKASLPSRSLGEAGAMAGASSTVPITGLARAMVKSMNASLKIPHFTFTEEVVVDALHATKGLLNATAQPFGLKLSYLPLVLKALSMALHEYPVLNASVSSDEV